MYFSDRETGPKPRVAHSVTANAWGGIVVAVQQRLRNGSFAGAFPSQCPDGRGIVSSNDSDFELALSAEIPDLHWPITTDAVPPTLAVLDFIEFCYRSVADPVQLDFHQFFGHYHLDFDRVTGRIAFRGDVNRILSRNGLAFTLGDDGQVIRLLPPVLDSVLASANFQTGDSELDGFLSSARLRFLDPEPTVRVEGLRTLWDAWERLKTLELGERKADQIARLLERVAPESSFRARLDAEGRELTSIGNSFLIRHSETTQTPLQLPEHVDYLFHRMFCLIYLSLRMTSRAG